MIYFDNAATGFPKDIGILKTMLESFMSCGNPGRSGHIYSLRASETLYSVRETIADYFNSIPENVILCPSATYALNIAIKGLYTKNKKIIISDLEHNSVIRPCFSISETIIFSVDIDDDEKTLENFEKKLTKDVSLAVVTHASNICGRILPIEKMASICKRKNIVFILDASQTTGYQKIDLSKSDVDVICLPGHKGLYGPMGTGALIINPKSDIHFKTIIEGGTGILSWDKSMPQDLPERLEAGTLGVHNFAALESAIKTSGYKVVNTQNMYSYIINELSKMNNIIIYGYSEKNIQKYVPIILFNSKDITPSELSSNLSEKDICVRSGFHCAPIGHLKLKTGENGAVRISLGKKNKYEECVSFISILKEILK